MKKLTTLFAMSLLAGATVYGQEVDDMYFNSKDRTKVVNTKPVSSNVTLTQAEKDGNAQINPTDSYSGRGQNPEYTPQSSAQNAEPNYFDASYKPNGNQTTAAPYYGNSSYSGMNSMYDPYNSMAYGSPYGYGGYSSMGMGYGYGSPYYGMGSSSSLSFMLSSGYGYGSPYSSMGYGYGSPYYSPFSYGYGGYGLGYGCPYYGYSNSYVTDGNGYTTGRRASRSSNMNNTVSNYTRSGNSGGSTVQDHSNPGSRVATQSQYYQRGWKSNPVTNPSGTGRSWGSNNSSNSSSWGSRSSNYGSSGSGYSSGGSSRSFGGGGGSSGGSSGGGGGRGRH